MPSARQPARRCPAGRGSHLACALLALGLLAQPSASPRATFVPGLRGPLRQSRLAARSRRFAAPAVEIPKAAGGAAAEAAPEDAAAAGGAYVEWADQFPIAAARRDFYGLPCGRADVEGRFLSIARLVGISATEALEIFRSDLWVLSISTEKLIERLEALREVVTEEEEVVEFLRFAPRTLGTTTAAEIRERGVSDMKARSLLGAGYELLVSPIRLLFKAMAQNTARDIECETDETCSVEVLEAAEKRQQETRNVQGAIFLGLSLSFISYLLYSDWAYGGPIHGKGLCPASPIPTFNIPDAEGNARLPCNCAPIWKWYIEPQLPPEQRLRFQPKVESKNCGRLAGGATRECNPTTVGGCVWTAEDLEKDPSTWDRREPTYWERQRASGKV